MKACHLRLLAFFLLLNSTGTSLAQDSRSALEGMWSDPPVNPSDFMCFLWCTDSAIDRLNALLDDPANDDRPFGELWAETSAWQVAEYVRPRLTADALTYFPLDELDDPGYLNCEPWGFARQMLAPHQLRIQHFDDRIEMTYGEWEARRTVYLDAARLAPDRPPRRMGYSTGRYEGDALVIETSGVSADITMWLTRHSNQLAVTERYQRDGDRLIMTAVIEDPATFTEPLEIRKVWGWAPDEEIYPYEDCEIPAETEGN